jgi:hypothetical protein
LGENSSDFREAFLELVDSTSPEPADHPSHERWLAYQRGELPAEEEARLAEHLARCRDCCDLVQAADALFGPGEEADAGKEEGEALATAALWRLLRPRLFSVREISAGRAPRPAWRFRLPDAVAASFFLALLGMSAWNLELRSALKALRAPRPNVQIVDFSAGERLPAADEKTLTAGSGPWTLVIHPSAELRVYRLTIRDTGIDREPFSPFLLRPDADSALTLLLPEVPPGRYRLDLQDGAGGSSGRVLEKHYLRVTAAGRGG